MNLWQPHKDESLGFPHSLCWHGVEGEGLCCLSMVEQLLSKSACLARLPWSPREEAFIENVSLVCVHWHLWIASFFSSKSEIHEKKRKPRSIPPRCSLGPKVPRKPPSFSYSLYLSVSVHICVCVYTEICGWT